MQSEQQQSISQVRLLLQNLSVTIPTLPIGSDLRNSLEEKSMDLEELLFKLEQEDVKQIIKDLNKTKTQLEEVVKKMSQSNKELKKLSEDIEGVAKVLGTLIEVIALIP